MWPNMKITFCGAAGEVTGSTYLLETRVARVLVDFGIFQGRDASDEKNRQLDGLMPRRIDAVVLTHAHLDHCGRLPLLPQQDSAAGFMPRRRLVTSPGSCSRTRRGSRWPTWSGRTGGSRGREDRWSSRFTGPRKSRPSSRGSRHCRTASPAEIAQGMSLRFFDAGHILGSASVEMTVEENGKERMLIFSGDLGPKDVPILRDPVPPDPPAGPDLVVLESTYGDRDHRPMDATLDEFRQILKEAIASHDKVLIPSFAIGRTQQILYHIAEFIRDGAAPQVSDLPRQPDGHQGDGPVPHPPRPLRRGSRRAGQGRSVRRRTSPSSITPRPPTSRGRINNLRGMAVIIAGSGMCEGGRIVHHLKHGLWRPSTQVIIVGYQSAGSLGSQLVHGARRVRIHGEEIEVKAGIHTLGGFSAHAGQTELAGWAGNYLSGPDSSPGRPDSWRGQASRGSAGPARVTTWREG